MEVRVAQRLQQRRALLLQLRHERFDVRQVARFRGELPPTSPEVELVLYRVAQEALTNALRHSGAGTIVLELEHDDDVVTLRVADDGCGVGGAPAGGGMQGMRERAMLIGAQLSVRDGGGTEVVLTAPVGA